MKRSKLVKGAVLTAMVASVGAADLAAQHAVVSHDEWLTHPSFFGANEQRFVSNSLSWFGLSGSGNILINTNNSFLTNSNFRNYLTALGYSVTVDANALSFGGYSAVFGGGNSSFNGAELAAYVRGGGNVFYVGGTGAGGAAAEAAYSNTFLNPLGLAFSSPYNGIGGNVNTSGFASQGPYGSALFDGVSSVYANNGNSAGLTAVPVAGVSTQVFNIPGGPGVFAAAQVREVSVPEPGTYLLLFGGLLGLGLVARRRRAFEA